MYHPVHRPHSNCCRTNFLDLLPIVINRCHIHDNRSHLGNMHVGFLYRPQPHPVTPTSGKNITPAVYLSFLILSNSRNIIAGNDLFYHVTQHDFPAYLDRHSLNTFVTMNHVFFIRVSHSTNLIPDKPFANSDIRGA